MGWRRFVPADLGWYAGWFQDPELHRWLGPVADVEWLTREPHEPVWVLDDAGTAVVLELTLDDGTHGFHGIIGLSVAPHRRRRGLGRRAVSDLLGGVLEVPPGAWVAFVEPANTAARTLFRGIAASERMDAGMIRFDF